MKQTLIWGTAVVVTPVMTSCISEPSGDLRQLPFKPGDDWDPVRFNRDRGNAGAIPASYLADINGPDGEKKHIGKHLPYIADIDPLMVPKGFIPLMWGNPSFGYTPHPNAVAGASNNHQGHWYNWIRIRKATLWYAQTAESTFSDWPIPKETDNGAYAAKDVKDITIDKGIHTIYLAQLPPDVKKGDIIRIWAHCLTHGEYIDFVQVK